jgi:hypothetical protein
VGSAWEVPLRPAVEKPPTHTRARACLRPTLSRYTSTCFKRAQPTMLWANSRPVMYPCRGGSGGGVCVWGGGGHTTSTITSMYPAWHHLGPNPRLHPPHPTPPHRRAHAHRHPPPCTGPPNLRPPVVVRELQADKLLTQRPHKAREIGQRQRLAPVIAKEMCNQALAPAAARHSTAQRGRAQGVGSGQARSHGSMLAS